MTTDFISVNVPVLHLKSDYILYILYILYYTSPTKKLLHMALHMVLEVPHTNDLMPDSTQPSERDLYTCGICGKTFERSRCFLVHEIA